MENYENFWDINWLLWSPPWQGPPIVLTVLSFRQFIISTSIPHLSCSWPNCTALPPWFHLRSLCSGKPPYILHLSPHSWDRGLLSVRLSFIHPRRVVDFLGILAFYFLGSDDFYAFYVQNRKLKVTYIFFQGHFFLSLNCVWCIRENTVLENNADLGEHFAIIPCLRTNHNYALEN